MAGALAPFILVGILKCSGDLKLSFLLLGSAIISKVYPGLIRPQSVQTLSSLSSKLLENASIF